MKICGKLIKLGVMSEARPCIRKAGHVADKHTPNLIGMRFDQLRVIKRGPNRVYPNGQQKTYWWTRDNKNRKRLSAAQCLFSGQSTGRRAPMGSGSIHRLGYRVIRIDGRPVLEHRHVMSKVLGRPLTRRETVHHGPKGRACNDPGNLSIRLKGNHPTGHSEQELAAWLVSLGWKVTAPQRLHKNRRREKS